MRRIASRPGGPTLRQSGLGRVADALQYQVAVGPRDLQQRDYLRAHGQEQVAAACFSGGAVQLGEAAFGTLIGPGFLSHFPGATADDLPANIAAMRGLVR